MELSEVHRAVEAARSTVSGLGLRVDDAVVVNNSDRIAVRLTPCDVLARVSPEAHHVGATFEVEVARHLARTGSPVAELEPRVEPRVHIRGGFAVSLWTYYEPGPPSDIRPAAYADALARLHAGFREVEFPAPHFTDRVADAQRLVADREDTPELPDPDRELLGDTLSRLGTEIGTGPAQHQLLHGEPHPGNLLSTQQGLLFIDLETCCRGPVEFDLAHGLLPSEGGQLGIEELCEHYPGACRRTVEQSLILIWAMISTWRWRRDDQFPNRNYWRTETLSQLRSGLDRNGENTPTGHA